MIESQFAVVHQRQDLDRDGQFERAGHGKGFGAAQGDGSAGLDMDCIHAGYSIGGVRNIVDLLFEACQGRVGRAGRKCGD